MDRESLYDRYTAAKIERDMYMPLWRDISRYVGIGVTPDQTREKKSTIEKMDTYVDDPTAAISVNQFGDYMLGIMWGTGDGTVSVLPSNDVLQRVKAEEVAAWYKFVTDQVQYHTNHPNAGLNTALKPYAYDQATFGNSGVGAFPNPRYRKGDHNALIFRNYGVDNTSFSLGLNGMPETIYVDCRWSIQRIIEEFCSGNDGIDQETIKKLPKKIRESYERGKMSETFDLVLAVMPRGDYDPKLIGKRGRRYVGAWFLNDKSSCEVFREENYSSLPIAMCRQIVVRGETYGRASGTMMLSTIKSVNFMVGTVMEILEKQGDPALGIFNNALFGDSVLDSSPHSLTVFNPAVATDKNPVFPLYDVGDPSGIIKILIPYLNEKITTAFKVDALLDFNSAKDMTATESLQRYAIRGKSLSGLLVQQKSELLYPLCVRCVNLLWEMGELGIDASANQNDAFLAKNVGRGNTIIPDVVRECVQAGKPWYEIKFNNELEKLTRTEAVEALLKVLQAVSAVAAIYPAIVEAIDWYQYVHDLNEFLLPNSRIMIGAEAFKAKLQAKAQQQQQMLAVQAGHVAAQAQNQSAQAAKTGREAMSV